MPQIQLTNSNSAPTRILVVEDEADIRRGLTRLLRLEGYSVDGSASGREALLQVAHTAYDLMILDMQMPGMGGKDVIRQVSEHGHNLPIVVLTGHGSLDTAIAAIRSKIVLDYLLKPVDNETLLSTIETTLKEHRQKLEQTRLADAAATMLNFLSHADSPSPSPTEEVEFSESAAKNGVVLAVPPLTLYLNTREVILGNDPKNTSPIELSKGEVAILAGFLKAPNQILSCLKLVELSWGYDVDAAEAESLVRPYIFRLRQKLETNSKKPQLIQTVRRHGYRFVPSQG